MKLPHPQARQTNDGTLVLGLQTNPDCVEQNALWKANAWAKDLPKAKSFTILSRTNTDYHGNTVVGAVTGYGKIVVQYFSTLKEGAHPVSNDPKVYGSP